MASKEGTSDDGIPVVRIEEMAIVDLASLLDDNLAADEKQAAKPQSAVDALLSTAQDQDSPETAPPVLKEKASNAFHIDLDGSASNVEDEAQGGVFKIDIDGLDDFEALLQRTMGEAAGIDSAAILSDAPTAPTAPTTPTTPTTPTAPTELRGAEDGAARRKATLSAASAKWRTPKREVKKDTEQTEDASAAIDELRKKVKEMTSETESYRKRLQAEAKATRGKGREDVFKALMPIMDALELALKSIREGHDVDQLTEGIEMVLKRLVTDLGLLGLEIIAPEGAVFDPTVHEAFQQVTTGKVEPGQVAEVVRRGYRFEERLLRAAQVLVEKA